MIVTDEGNVPTDYEKCTFGESERILNVLELVYKKTSWAFGYGRLECSIFWDWRMDDRGY